jgi:hypothetical protein
MNGGGSSCIEKGLWNGQRKVNIKGSMKEKTAILSSMFFLLVLVIVKLLN